MRFQSVLDDEVMRAFQLLARTEGILAALESCHALAFVADYAGTLSPDKILVVNLSGRGDKDIFLVADYFDDRDWRDYCRRFAEGKLT